MGHFVKVERFIVFEEGGGGVGEEGGCFLGGGGGGGGGTLAPATRCLAANRIILF